MKWGKNEIIFAWCMCFWGLVWCPLVGALFYPEFTKDWLWMVGIPYGAWLVWTANLLFKD